MLLLLLLLVRVLHLCHPIILLDASIDVIMVLGLLLLDSCLFDFLLNFLLVLT